MDEEQKEPIKEVYKYQNRITIDLQSNNILSIRRISNKFFCVNPMKSENDPDDLDTYVSISRCNEEIRPRVNSGKVKSDVKPSEEWTEVQQKIKINRPEVVKDENKC